MSAGVAWEDTNTSRPRDACLHPPLNNNVIAQLALRFLSIIVPTQKRLSRGKHPSWSALTGTYLPYDMTLRRGTADRFSE